MSAPAISVIVPHYNDLERLDRCLASLSTQSMARERYEIVVADNMSPCGRTAVEAAIAGRARVVEAPDKGAGPTRNAAVAASVGETLAFIDADCIAHRDWLVEGIAALAGHDLVGGRMVVLVEGEGAKSGAEAFEVVFAFDNEAYVKAKHFSVTANLLCPRAVFDATGPFRVGMSEDVDWCLRARAKGYRIGYAPAAVVEHPARPDWQALKTKWRRINAELFELALLQPGGRMRWGIRSLALPVSIVAHIPKVIRSKALNGPGERMAALATLARLRSWRFVDANLRVLGLRR